MEWAFLISGCLDTHARDMWLRPWVLSLTHTALAVACSVGKAMVLPMTILRATGIQTSSYEMLFGQGCPGEEHRDPGWWKHSAKPRGGQQGRLPGRRVIGTVM